MAYNGVIPVNMSGHRKPTIIRCNKCSEAAGETVWHRTARGIDPEVCPLEGLGRAVGHSAVSSRTGTPALIPREKLGTAPRVTNWQVVKVGGMLPTGEE